MRKTNSVLGQIACLMALTILSLNLWAGRLYQYEDENGRTVLDDRVPKSFIHKGYKVLNDKGYVLEIVPPAMTEDEKKAFREEKQRQKALKKLFKTYSDPEDAELARDRQMSMLDSQISVKKGVVARLTAQKKRENEKAADLERRGRKVYESIIEKIERLERQIIVAREDIVNRELEKEETRERFEKDIQQLRRLLNVPEKTQAAP